ncbi:protein phosphatase 1E-like [Uranotaenia lowii]|uniref:protein phosphatase 1E-like n=1 Tax=Uranotaenia lowii TaxID=190385 RepID=UPI00247B157F|nr:protein phosphatase 1E-like [Uranotaenia lowii]
MEKCREFLDYFKDHVDPKDQLPIPVARYNIFPHEIPAEVAYWAHQYLVPMNCPQILLCPIINTVIRETQKSCTKSPKDCGFDGCGEYTSFNPLKLSSTVITHINLLCERLLDNAELNEILNEKSCTLVYKAPLHLAKAIKNTRRTMEDRHVCFSNYHELFDMNEDEPTSFYGIFDGHGGQDAAVYAAAHLCNHLAKSPDYPKNIHAAMQQAFVNTDYSVVGRAYSNNMYSGTTAVVCLYRAKESDLHISWVGDSQALLVSEGRVCQIVTPHVASMESERNRIRGMGGKVVNWQGSYRVLGTLALTRAIGMYKQLTFASVVAAGAALETRRTRNSPTTDDRSVEARRRANIGHDSANAE